MRNERARLAQAESASKFVDFDGLKLHYLDWGGDPRRRTFLMLHGGAAHAHWWSYVAPQLIAHGRARWMNRKIAGSVYREIPRAFHHVPLDNPEATASEIIAFVESI